MEPHASGILSTLIASLVAAFAGGLAVRVVGLPPLLGYLLAGIALGPFTPGFIADQSVAAELAEIGVALLMFNIGLHFSLKDLAAVRKIAVYGALVQMTISCTLGFFLAKSFLNCPPTAALMIGLCFSVASTAVSTRLLDEKKQISSYAGRVALGWLVVQDIVVIMAMVVFPVVVNSEQMPYTQLSVAMAKTFLQLAGFATVILFVVRRFIPRLLSFVARVGSREMFTLAVIVMALGIAYGSSLIFGVSLALGAFFAGLVIGETDLNHHAAAEALSMQQVFTILFFVSAGMLFDPDSFARMPLGILAAWALIFLGIGVVTFIILLISRVRPEGASIVAGAFSQIGEFSFVLSQLGYKWKILNHIDRDLILAVALTSIVLNPLILYVLPKIGKWIGDSKLVVRWRGDGEAHIPVNQPYAGHVVLVGHGRVGRMVAEALATHNIAAITIESDRRLMEKLLNQGLPVIFGDGAREHVLKAAHMESAGLLIVTIPHGGHVRRIVAQAKKLNPLAEIIVRVHEDSEARHIARLGVGLAVMGEREIAIGLSAFALQHYGVESHVVLETLSAMRQKSQVYQRANETTH